MITGLNQCHFCGKFEEEVKALIVGPMVTICDDCIFMAVYVLDHEFHIKEPKEHPDEIDKIAFRVTLAINELETYRNNNNITSNQLSNALVALREANIALKDEGALAVLGNAKISR